MGGVLGMEEEQRQRSGPGMSRKSRQAVQRGNGEKNHTLKPDLEKAVRMISVTKLVSLSCHKQTFDRVIGAAGCG
jgi:hypothetical protein